MGCFLAKSLPDLEDEIYMSSIFIEDINDKIDGELKFLPSSKPLNYMTIWNSPTSE